MHIETYFEEVKQISSLIDKDCLSRIADQLIELRERGGRLFFLGVGGSAANCSHAVNDFRKLCGIEAYAPSDNVSELTARANDEGWDSIFTGWLKVSKAESKDAVFVFSVGGGNVEKNVSPNIVSALEFAIEKNLTILGVVGRDGGFTKRVGNEVLVIPTVDDSRVTPHSEAFQAVVWHCLVSHPQLQQKSTKW